MSHPLFSYSKNLCKTATLKKIENWFSRPIIALMQVKSIAENWFSRPIIALMQVKSIAENWFSRPIIALMQVKSIAECCIH